MKQYGANFSTEFTKKQINVVYGKAKSGVLNVEKWFIEKLYNAADFYGYDDNRSMAAFEVKVKAILDLLFSGNMEECQKAIDEATESEYNTYSERYRAKFNRNMVA